jgi:hypothetical protein
VECDAGFVLCCLRHFTGIWVVGFPETPPIIISNFRPLIEFNT